VVDRAVEEVVMREIQMQKRRTRRIETVNGVVNGRYAPDYGYARSKIGRRHLRISLARKILRQNRAVQHARQLPGLF
jgi:hypothetical protein